jgi:hypothetical protein
MLAREACVLSIQKAMMLRGVESREDLRCDNLSLRCLHPLPFLPEESERILLADQDSPIAQVNRLTEIQTDLCMRQRSETNTS